MRPLNLLSFLSLFAVLSSAQAEEPYQVDLIPAGYAASTVPTPVDEKGAPLQFGIGGIAFGPGGSAFVASRVEGIWKYRDGTWTRFSDHLHDPQGIVVLDANTVVVAQKPELTLVRDTDDDGTADIYKTLCDAWRNSGNYCEYIHGPVVDSKGNYYININLADAARDPASFKGGGAAMGTTGGYDGWFCRITPEGEFEPLAMGLRSPAGIGIDRHSDDIFMTDNQGGWIGTSTLNHMEEGAFYGYPASLIDLPEYRAGKKGLDLKEFESKRKAPALWLPHGELANSPGNPEFNYTEGKFGPFEGQVFIGCQTRSNILRANLEKIKGEYQGAAFNFLDHLQSGCIRITFGPEGALWVGQTGRGWRSKGGALFGLQKIRWDGETIPFEMKAINLTNNGYLITFTRPVDPATLDASKIKVSHWKRHYHGTYGSKKIDQVEETAELLSIAKDGLSARIAVPLITKKVYQITLEGVRAKDGGTMSTNTGYYTLNQTLGPDENGTAKESPKEAGTALRWKAGDGVTELLAGERTVWRFNAGPNAPKPSFHPITLKGTPSLSYQPPLDHHWHHGLWFSWKSINGLNYWEENKDGSSEGLTSWKEPVVRMNRDFSALIDMNLSYSPPGKPPVLSEARHILISPPEEDGSFHMDWSMVFTAGDEPVELNRTPLPGEPGGKGYGGYAGLSMRLNPELEKRAFTATNPDIANPMRFKATAMDYQGVLGNRPVGVAIFDHHRNLNAPSPWYVIKDSPSSMHYFSPAVIQFKTHTLNPGETLTLRYRISFHQGHWTEKELTEECKRFSQ